MGASGWRTRLTRGTSRGVEERGPSPRCATPERNAAYGHGGTDAAPRNVRQIAPVCQYRGVNDSRLDIFV